MNKSLWKGKPVDKDTCEEIMWSLYFKSCYLDWYVWLAETCFLSHLLSYFVFLWNIFQTLQGFDGVHVVVNFLSQVIFIFLQFRLDEHTLPYPKQKKKEIKS